MNTEPLKNEEQFKLPGDWNTQSKKLIARYPQLNDADLKCEPGKEVEMLKRVEVKLNINRNEVIGIINSERITGRL